MGGRAVRDGRAAEPEEDLAQAREALKTLRTQALEGIEKDDNLPSDEARAAAKQVVGAK